MKMDHKWWWVIGLVILFAALAAIYMAIQPGNNSQIKEMQQQDQQILNP